MTDFEASNGATINEIPYPGFKMLTVKTPDNTTTLAGVHVDALREFFQHERDEELGRWRDPDNPRLTVYPTEGYETDEITILDEVDAETYTITRARAERSQGGWWHDTAKAYFEAHPERKPWEEAKLGEVWILSTAYGENAAYSVMTVREAGTVFESHDGRYSLDDADIEDARRIWPEDAS